MMMKKLTELARYIRSKNAGPFLLSLDIVFDNAENYRRVIQSNVITPSFIASLYRIPEQDVHSIISYDPAKALKITIRRQKEIGAFGDSDIYGAQQHAPLLTIKIP
jgi:hypothetical protein